jgi:hypothetical protein
VLTGQGGAALAVSLDREITRALGLDEVAGTGVVEVEARPEGVTSGRKNLRGRLSGK